MPPGPGCPYSPVQPPRRAPPLGRPGTRAPGRRVLLLVGRPVPRSGAGRKARVLPRREALRERAVAGALPGRPEGQARSPRAQRQGAKRWDGRGFHGPGFAVDPGGLAGLETLRAAPAPPGAWRSPARRLARFAPLAGRWPAPRRCRRPGGRAPRGQAGCLRGAGGARPRTERPGGPGASLARAARATRPYSPAAAGPQGGQSAGRGPRTVGGPGPPGSARPHLPGGLRPARSCPLHGRRHPWPSPPRPARGPVLAGRPASGGAPVRAAAGGRAASGRRRSVP